MLLLGVWFVLLFVLFELGWALLILLCVICLRGTGCFVGWWVSVDLFTILAVCFSLMVYFPIYCFVRFLLFLCLDCYYAFVCVLLGWFC